jgi:CspA family cold shock protein
MATGKVIWFIPSVGLGFIRPDDGSPEVIVELFDVQASGLSGLEEAQPIAYEKTLIEGGKARATNLRPL